MTREREALRVFLGPVQSFIAAGRRTRDFWAGSFLLSLLSGTAMDAVIGDGGETGGRITIPAVHGEDMAITEKTLKSIRDARAWGTDEARYRLPEDEQQWRGPMAGTLVNHFRAEIPPSFDPGTMVGAVRNRFKAISNEVLQYFIEPALTDYVRADREAAAGAPQSRQEQAKRIRERWDLQTDGSFFDILWVKGPIDEGHWREESRWLDRRKTARIQLPLDETTIGLAGTGDRCPVHPDLCELGGFSRVYEREQQDDFWEVLRRTVGTKMYHGTGWRETGERFRDTLEIREGERLSGLALVKRLFPLLEPEGIARSIGWVPDFSFDFSVGTPPEDWTPEEAQRTLRNWPSTAFIAAIPWIVVAGGHAENEAHSYANKQYERLGAGPILRAERPQHHRIKSIDRLPKVSRNGNREVPLFAVLDGTLHFRRGLEKHRFAKWSRITGKAASKDEKREAEGLARDLTANFRRLSAEVEAPIRSALRIDTRERLRDDPAAPFYAMLEMDGDGMGEIFSHSRARAERGSKALLEFAEGVAGIVREHDGILIYAGADDVNAMLPIDTSIACALEIREHWQKSMQIHFPVEGDCRPPTLSGSIVFADYQNALDDVRKLNHERLDRVAKDGMGRDALALAVMKSGGTTAEWASSWDFPRGLAGPKPDDAAGPPQALFGYARASSATKSIASRLPFVIRERFLPILDTQDNGSDLFDDAQLAKLIAKELSDSGLVAADGSGEEEKEGTDVRSKRVVDVLRPYGRRIAETVVKGAPRHVGGLLIARFLADNVFWPYFREWEQHRSGDGETGGKP